MARIWGEGAVGRAERNTCRRVGSVRAEAGRRGGGRRDVTGSRPGPVGRGEGLGGGAGGGGGRGKRGGFWGGDGGGGGLATGGGERTAWRAAVEGVGAAAAAEGGGAAMAEDVKRRTLFLKIDLAVLRKLRVRGCCGSSSGSRGPGGGEGSGR